LKRRKKALKDILETGSKDDLEAKTNDLSETLQKIGAAAYQQASEAGQAQAAAGGAGTAGTPPVTIPKKTTRRMIRRLKKGKSLANKRLVNQVRYFKPRRSSGLWQYYNYE